MIHICVLHCSNEIVQKVFEIINNTHISRTAKLFLPVHPEYELEYFIRHRKMNIAILDAEFMINGYDGVFLAKRIKVINRETLLIFISKTTDTKQMKNIINAEAFAYIESKNISNELPIVLNKAISIASKDITIFTYLKRNEKINISLKKVIYFSSSHRIIKYIDINGREDYFYDKMDDTEEVVAQISADFIRVNQSYLINMKYIISLIGNEITMINNHTIIISRKYHDSKYAIHLDFYQ